jgi:hypothetical protein
MTLDTRILLLEGLALHVGPRSAFECNARFNELYLAKNGTCVEYVMNHLNQKDAGIKYMRREARAFEKYVLQWAHYKTKVNV